MRGILTRTNPVMVELVYTRGLSPRAGNGLRVQIPLAGPKSKSSPTPSRAALCLLRFVLTEQFSVSVVINRSVLFPAAILARFVPMPGALSAMRIVGETREAFAVHAHHQCFFLHVITPLIWSVSQRRGFRKTDFPGVFAILRLPISQIGP